MRIVTFAGYCWEVHPSKTRRHPGPNLFSDSEENVRVDEDGLHLRITQRENAWHCSEVSLDTPLGFGTYSFTLSSDIAIFDRHTVFGAFLYENDSQEIDIEISPSMVGRNKIQFAIQPWLRWNHRKRINAAPHGATTCSLTWLPTSVIFAAHHSGEAAPGASWTYKKSAIHSQKKAKFMFNLWLYKGAQVLAPEHIVISAFSFTPAG